MAAAGWQSPSIGGVAFWQILSNNGVAKRQPVAAMAAMAQWRLA